MSGKIFISYRRDDSRYQARMIYEAFLRRMPRENVFMDIDTIPLGVNFVKVLEGWVEQCEVLLVLMGPDWANSTDPKTGKRRLDNPKDFVRVEIRGALTRDIPVVPVMLDGAEIPDEAQLPDDIKGLLSRNAEFVEYRNFDADVQRLIKKLGVGGSAKQAAAPPTIAGTPRDQAIERSTRSSAEDFEIQGDLADKARERRTLSKEWTKLSLTPKVGLTGLVAAAVVGALIVWSPGPMSRKKEEVAADSVERARQAAEVRAAVAEKARQAAEAKAAEAMVAGVKSEQARQAAEAQAVDAERARQAASAKAADAEKARQAAEAKAAEATAAAAKSTQARQATETQAADAERARQAAAAKAADAEKARQAAEAKAVDAEKARQAAEAKAAEATDAATKSAQARQAAEAQAVDAERARQAAEPKAAGAVASGQFKQSPTSPQQTVVGDTSPPDLITDCDWLAAYPDDLQRPKIVPGVLLSHIDVALALAACNEAVSKYPDIGRFSYQLGRVLLEAKDYSAAYKQYERAIRLGSTAALNNIGLLYLNGQGVPQDYAEARRWLEKAIAAGEPGAIGNIGNLYRDGKGVPQDYAQARQWYEKAAAGNSTAAMTNIGNLYRDGKGVPQDYAQARQWYEKAAALGDAAAMNNIGSLYRDGKGVPQDYAQARQWYEKGTASAAAMSNIGVLYDYGRGVQQDYGQARQWYEKAAALGDVAAMNNIGVLYENGRGVQQDYAQARQWYEKAAAGNSTVAMNNIGGLYENGRGVQQDYAQARQWYEKAAAGSLAAAMNNIGVLYENGRGVQQDYAQARQWYEKAAAGNSTIALNNIGVLYENGRGVQQDYAQARQWYEKAAAGSLAAAMNNIGNLYRDGKGVPQDYAQARQWYEKAAAGNSPTAMSNIGYLYENGRGVQQDYAEARRWYEKAAAGGNSYAMIHLGDMYLRGHGVDKSLADARTWYEKAAAAGDAQAKDKLAALPSPAFSRRSNMEAKRDIGPLAAASVASVDVCEQNCTRATGCNVFTYNKKSGYCFTYRDADLVTNEDYDSGVLATVPSGLASPTGQFSRRSNMEANGTAATPWATAEPSIVYCEQTCAQLNTCKVFTYNKTSGSCYLFSVADLVSNENYDSGVLATVATVTSGPASPSGQFSRRSNMEANGTVASPYQATVASTFDCEQNCARSNTCKVYSYDKITRSCFMYSAADLSSNATYDSGILTTVATVGSPGIENASQAVSGFTISPDTTATGPLIESRPTGTINDCRQRCTNMTGCRVFTFGFGFCWLYTNGTFSQRPGFVSGGR
jgi:TPR repeat protein